jgi:hypothetical protein
LAGVVGCLAAALVALGNPGNMGICGACFLRDLAGSLGLFGGKGPKIFRPEVVGVAVGAFAWVLFRGRFAARSGSNAATRFFFGVWMAFGALVFLGCPFRMLQRLGGGDVNAWIGLPGFVLGVGLGHFFERRGYTVGKTSVVAPAVGLLGPVSAVGLLGLFLVGGFLVGPGPGSDAPPPHAPWGVALALALVAGVLLSATGFCGVNAARQVFQPRRRMLAGAAALVLGYAVVAIATGGFKWGMEGQPAAHTDAVWNFLSLGLVGITGVLSGGCPVRQIVMAGEGNGDAFLTAAGLVAGGALAHVWGIASSGAGTTSAGRWAVVIGLVVATGYAALTSRAAAKRP